MKILITGATGQLGRQLSRCIETGENELGEISKSIKSAEVMALGSSGLDISKIDDVLELFEKFKPDIAINSSAYTNVDACESNIDQAFLVNAIGARNMAIAAERTGSKLIHVSTDYVFSGEGNVPFREYDLTDPKSIYGKTKNQGEEFVRQFCKKHFIVRTSWLYGLYGGNFVKTIIKAGKERGALKVVDDQRGNPTNVEDLIYHILKLIETEEYGTYHCTGNGECSWYDFAKLIVEFAGINATVDPVTTDEFPRPAKRPSYSSLDNMCLRITVGDEMRVWQEALRSFISSIDVANI